MMPLHIAIQMDPIDSIKIQSDSTILLGLEAQRRGHQLYYYQPDQLALKQGKVMAPLTQLTLFENQDHYFELGNTKIQPLQDMDVVLMRQDPPFDMNYLTYTYLLELIHPKTLVINNPTQVRNCPEKLFVWQFPQFAPPTVISKYFPFIESFYQEHQQVILKPLYSFAGSDVFRPQSLQELKDYFDQLCAQYQSPVIIQKFLSNISLGDKRIFLIDGEYAAALNRIPKEGEYLSNLAQGGKAVTTVLTEREKAICAALGPELKKREILLAGIDVIDGYLTEINITSPTGLTVIKRLYDINLAVNFWDAVERKRTTHHS